MTFLGKAIDLARLAGTIGTADRLCIAEEANFNFLQGFFLGLPADNEATALLLARQANAKRDYRRSV